jgi:hypothetical protein
VTSFIIGPPQTSPFRKHERQVALNLAKGVIGATSGDALPPPQSDRQHICSEEGMVKAGFRLQDEIQSLRRSFNGYPVHL